MQPPPVQYVTTSDGINIAYTMGGEGPPLVFVPNLASHVLLAWETVHLGEWMRRLSEHFTVVRYDSRGMGMSTRGLRAGHSVDAYQVDLECVVDRLQLDNFVLCAQGSGGLITIRYAARHPARVAALILLSVAISLQKLRAGALIFNSLAEQDWDMFQHVGASANIASSQDLARTVEIYKQSVTQQEWLASRRGARHDMDAELAKLRTPTLVLHPRDCMGLPVEAAMNLAQLSKGRLVLIDGADSRGDATQGVQAIEDFLADLASEEPKFVPAPSGLSLRELEVLRLLAAGKSNQQIANDLTISTNTVARHITHIFDKTGATNRVEATSYAHRHSLV